MTDKLTILTIRDVADRLTIGVSTLHRYAKTVPDFPRKIKLGPKRTGYLLSDVEQYIQRQYEAARRPTE